MLSIYNTLYESSHTYTHTQTGTHAYLSHYWQTCFICSTLVVYFLRVYIHTPEDRDVSLSQNPAQNLSQNSDPFNVMQKYLLIGKKMSETGLTMEVSTLNVPPSLDTSALGSICEGKENGSECLLVNSLPVQGSLELGATTGTLGIGRGSHDSPRRPQGTGGSLSLDKQSPGVQGKGRLCGRDSAPTEYGRSGGGGGGRSRSVGGIGNGLSL